MIRGMIALALLAVATAYPLHNYGMYGGLGNPLLYPGISLNMDADLDARLRIGGLNPYGMFDGRFANPILMSNDARFDGRFADARLFNPLAGWGTGFYGGLGLPMDGLLWKKK